MTTFLIILAGIVALLLLLTLANPVLMVITGGTIQKVKAVSQISGEELAATLTLTGSDSPMFVMSLDVPRGVAEQLRLGPPEGFVIERLEDKRSDPAWIENWNRENIRFAGKLQLTPNSPSVLRFPLKAPPAVPFEVKGQVEAGRTFMNSMIFFEIKVGG